MVLIQSRAMKHLWGVSELSCDNQKKKGYLRFHVFADLLLYFIFTKHKTKHFYQFTD